MPASEKLYRIKDRAFEAVRSRLRERVPTTEFDIQQLMWQWFDEEGLTSDAPPLVAAQENASNPHYMPTKQTSRAIRPDELLLLDLWGKLKTPGAVFADISWVGFTGAHVPSEMARVFEAARAARSSS